MKNIAIDAIKSKHIEYVYPYIHKKSNQIKTTTLNISKLLKESIQNKKYNSWHAVISYSHSESKSYSYTITTGNGKNRVYTSIFEKANSSFFNQHECISKFLNSHDVDISYMTTKDTNIISIDISRLTSIHQYYMKPKNTDSIIAALVNLGTEISQSIVKIQQTETPYIQQIISNAKELANMIADTEIKNIIEKSIEKVEKLEESFQYKSVFNKSMNWYNLFYDKKNGSFVNIDFTELISGNIIWTIGKLYSSTLSSAEDASASLKMTKENYCPAIDEEYIKTNNIKPYIVLFVANDFMEFLKENNEQYSEPSSDDEIEINNIDNIKLYLSKKSNLGYVHPIALHIAGIISKSKLTQIIFKYIYAINDEREIIKMETSEIPSFEGSSFTEEEEIIDDSMEIQEEDEEEDEENE